MLTRTEVADLCQVPTDTLRKWDELGIGPERVRLGRLGPVLWIRHRVFEPDSD